MVNLSEICSWLEEIAPLSLSEGWDNTGLLLGDDSQPISRVQTCLTLTPSSVDEAIQKRAELVISHHPLPFKPVARITTRDVSGKLIWQLASNGIAIYSPHTAWDSAKAGINQQLAEILGLGNCRPIVESEDPTLVGLGSGRIGELSTPSSLEDISSLIAKRIPHCRPRGVKGAAPIQRIAICCGSGGSLLSAALKNRCDLFLTGEATFHTCLEAEAAGCSLLMIGHFASERFAMEVMAQQLANEFANLSVWASETESDPVRSF